jgi:hypothetical protein
MAYWCLLLCCICLLTTAEATRSLDLKLLEVQEVSSLQISYRVVVNEAQEWSAADMQVCIWRAFTSSAATPYSMGSVQAAECSSGASGAASIKALQAGTYVINAVIVRKGIAELSSVEALSEIASLSVTMNEQLQIDLEGPDFNNDERMQRLQHSLHSMRSVLSDNCSELADLAVLGKHDAIMSSLLLDTSVNPYLLRTDVEVQPLLESECSTSTCTLQLAALHQHAKWTKVSFNVLRSVLITAAVSSFPLIICTFFFLCICRNTKLL